MCGIIIYLLCMVTDIFLSSWSLRTISWKIQHDHTVILELVMSASGGFVLLMQRRLEERSLRSAFFCIQAFDVLPAESHQAPESRNVSGCHDWFVSRKECLPFAATAD